jgi:hypothetical protein
MALILNGTDGLSDVDGSAATPAIRGTDANTGIFFPAADTIAFSEGGTEAMRINGSGFVGIGTTTPAYQLEVKTGSTFVGLNSDGTNGVVESNGALFVRTSTANPLVLGTNTTERMRIDSSGNLLVGTTSGFASERFRSNGSGFSPAASFTFSSTLGATSQNLLFFGSAHGLSGALLANNTAVSLANASDYRLKTNINPLIGGLNQVLSLKPKEFEWLNSNDNIKTQGFIAHEVQEVLPVAVFGEKDAVNEDGTIKSQMMDATKFIPIIISAIQELKAELDTVKSELATLKGAA